MDATIELPADLMVKLTELADRGQTTVSAVAIDLLRASLTSQTRPSVAIDTFTGLPTVTVGRPVSMSDIRELDDE